MPEQNSSSDMLQLNSKATTQCRGDPTSQYDHGISFSNVGLGVHGKGKAGTGKGRLGVV